MPNKFHKKSGALLCLLSLFLSAFFNIQTTFAAGFSDINETTKNYEAILYLQENGIINGYPDGTFKPYKAVNRAEFLKIIIEGSHIDLDIPTTTPFKDVDNNSWYAPYVKKAFAEGWINGYPDGTFKPAQTINKVEALKILGSAQSWQVNDIHPDSYHGLFDDIDIFAWYTPYVAYAKINGYLEETGSTFSPGALMSREGISETIYLTLTVASSDTTAATDTDTDTDTSPDPSTTSGDDTSTPIKPAPLTPTPKPKTTPEPDPSFTPVSFKAISTTSYDNITLSEALPNIFYKNEIYIIQGDINSGTYDKATIILNTEDQKTNNTFIGSVENNHFEIPIHFNNSGNYLLGLIPGESGQSKAYAISILSSTLNATNITTNAPQPITSFNIY
ncbi:MAG: S-layer homology domain-containing protein, partial [Patescibacteria group bacterium]